MNTSQSFGTFAIQLAENKNSYLLVTKPSFPKTGGGVCFSGVFSKINDRNSTEIQIHVSNDILDYSFTKMVKKGLYEGGIGLPFPDRMYEINLHAHSKGTHAYYGTARELVAKKLYKFSYTDATEPVTIGTVGLIVVGISAVSSALEELTELVVSQKYAALQVHYSARFNWNSGTFAGISLVSSAPCVA
jgi:hypothetical protein